MIVGLFGGEEAGLVGIEAPSYRGFRYPAEIISYCVWLYHRFPLSFREGQELVAQRGVVVSHETSRQWCAKFGQAMPTHYADAGLARGTSGTSTKCSSRSTARPVTCDGRWTSTGTCSTFW